MWRVQRAEEFGNTPGLFFSSSMTLLSHNQYLCIMQYWITEKTEQELKNMKFSLIGQVFRQLKLIKGNKEISDKVINETFDRLYEMSISEVEGMRRKLDNLLKIVMEERQHP